MAKTFSKIAITLAADHIKTEAAPLAVKHTHALDLVAAGLGQRSRMQLAAACTVHAPLPPKLDLTRLAEVASRLWTQPESSARAALAASTALTALLSGPERNSVVIHCTGSWSYSRPIDLDFTLDAAAVADPDAFFSSHPDGRAAVAKAAAAGGFVRWERAESLNATTANQAAGRLLDAKRQGKTESEALDGLFGANDAWDEVANAWHCDALLEALRAAEVECPEAVVEAFERALMNQLEDQDSSTPLDVLGNATAEVVFFFADPTQDLESGMLAQTKPWPEAATTRVDRALEWSMASLGYHLAGFRLLANNGLLEAEALAGVLPRREPLLAPSQVAELIDNSSASHALLCWYGIVSIRQLAELDLSQPVGVSGGEIGLYDIYNGAFFSERAAVETITLMPDEGAFWGVDRWYSPDTICGFVRSAFTAKLHQPKMA